jgi:cytoskeletal protein CcmA (bactofilin family)
MWNRDDRPATGPVRIGERPLDAGRPIDALRAAEREVGSGVAACIGRSVTIKGEVVSSEDLTVEGAVEGRLDLQGHSLTVGTHGSIRAEVAAESVIVHGTVRGNVTAREKVDVRATGTVEGDIRAPRIAIAEGATLSGRLETRREQATPKHESTTRALDKPMDKPIEKPAPKEPQPLAVAV